MEVFEIIKLLGTPYGVGIVGLFVSQLVIDRYELVDKQKVWASWGIGFVLTSIMLLAGKLVNFGAFVDFDFASVIDWFMFTIVALMSGLVSNGIFSSGFLEKLLKLIKKKK